MPLHAALAVRGFAKNSCKTLTIFFVAELDPSSLRESTNGANPQRHTQLLDFVDFHNSGLLHHAMEEIDLEEKEDGSRSSAFTKLLRLCEVVGSGDCEGLGGPPQHIREHSAGTHQL